MPRQRDPVWLAGRNAERALARAAAREMAQAEGRQFRGANDGMGLERAKQKYRAKQKNQRWLTRQRKLRRPFVQGRRRLWGKGPAPSWFTCRSTSIGAAIGHDVAEAMSSPRSDKADQGSPLVCAATPLSSFAPAGVPGSPTGLGRLSDLGQHDPLDTPLLDFLSAHLQEQQDHAEQMRARQHFRALAQHAGIGI